MSEAVPAAISEKNAEFSRKSRTPLILGGIFVLTAGIVLSAFFLSRFLLRIQQTTSPKITVKGIAEKNILSDTAAFSCTVSVDKPTIPEGYAAINTAYAKMLAKLGAAGFRREELSGETLSYQPVSKTVRTLQNGRETTSEVFSHYRFERALRVMTPRVKAVGSAHIRLYELAAEGIRVECTAPEYFLDNPEQYKLELVDAASASAYRRAKTVADKCGSRLGDLVTARQGVIQITRPASNDTSDYGTYDTSTPEKVMRVVVTLDFTLK